MSGGKPLLGWREWVQLPALGLQPIRAKVDTGAKTCALHAFYVEPFSQDGASWVRFGIHPQPNRHDLVVHCTAPLVETRPPETSAPSVDFPAPEGPSMRMRSPRQMIAFRSSTASLVRPG